MTTRPAGTPARNGMNVYEIYAGDLSRRVGLLTGNRRCEPITRPGARPGVPLIPQPVDSGLFEDD